MGFIEGSFNRRHLFWTAREARKYVIVFVRRVPCGLVCCPWM